MTALKAFSITNELSQFIPNAKKKQLFLLMVKNGRVAERIRNQARSASVPT